jgi:hypothetical protein
MFHGPGLSTRTTKPSKELFILKENVLLSPFTYGVIYIQNKFHDKLI